MRTYERLNAEVVKFEAQDVITASTPVYTGPACECNNEEYYENIRHCYGNNEHFVAEGGVRCPATEHNCTRLGSAQDYWASRE